MVGAIVKIEIGLYIWMVLPRLIYSKLKYQKNTPQFFVNIACRTVGIAIIAFAILRLIQSLFS
jgi:hypothetical protein